MSQIADFSGALLRGLCNQRCHGMSHNPKAWSIIFPFLSLHPLPCDFPSILWILLLWSCIPKRNIYFHYLWGNSTNLVAPLEKLPFMLVFYPFNGVQELGWFLIYILSEMFNQEWSGWIHKLWLFLFQSFNQTPTKEKDGSWFFCDGDI